MGDSSLLDALLDEQLLTPAQVQALRAAAPADLLNDLGQRGWLTTFQREHIRAGQLAGLRVGPYRLLEPLGAGGMGQVFKAWHPFMNRVVALKLIHPDRLGNAEAVARFLREIQVAAQLTHPNIVRAYDAAQAGDVHYLAMEFIEGRDLSRLIEERGPLPYAEACDLLRQAALGLQHAHERGLVHRDIKPANLLLTNDGVLKLLDLGLARTVKAPLPEEVDTLPSAEPGAMLTISGAIMGTPDYMAPEQSFDSRTVDIRADIYSLGCTLYHLLVGKPPFASHRTLRAKVWAHREAAPDLPLYRVRPDVPAALQIIVDTLMAKHPAHRLATPMQVAQALAAFTPPRPMANVPSLVTVAPPPPPAKEPTPEPDPPVREIPTLALETTPAMPATAPPAAPPQPAMPQAPKTESGDWLARLRATQDQQLRQADEQRRSQIAALEAIMMGQFEAQNWLVAYDTAAAILTLNPAHEQARGMRTLLGLSLRNQLRIRSVGRTCANLFMGLFMAAAVVGTAWCAGWLTEWFAAHWAGWFVNVVSYVVRSGAGAFAAGMGSVGLGGALLGRFTTLDVREQSSAREAIAVLSFLLGMIAGFLLGWESYQGFLLMCGGMLVAACLIAPGGDPFGSVHAMQAKL
jgi:serine/threonine protein kinase